jgi:hypothetical protein
MALYLRRAAFLCIPHLAGGVRRRLAWSGTAHPRRRTRRGPGPERVIGLHGATPRQAGRKQGGETQVGSWRIPEDGCRSSGPGSYPDSSLPSTGSSSSGCGPIFRAGTYRDCPLIAGSSFPGRADEEKRTPKHDANRDGVEALFFNPSRYRSVESGHRRGQDFDSAGAQRGAG